MQTWSTPLILTWQCMSWLNDPTIKTKVCHCVFACTVFALSAFSTFLSPTTTSNVLHEAFCLPNVTWIEKEKEVPKTFSPSTAEVSNASNGQPGNITMIVTANYSFNEHLPCAKQHSKCFTFIILLNSTIIQGRYHYYICFIDKESKLINGVAGVWTQAVLTLECELLTSLAERCN